MRVEVSIHSSDPPSPWTGYKLALQRGLEDPTNPTHVLVLQEDVLICRNFPLAVEQIAKAKTDQPVALFLSWLPPRLAKDARLAARKNQRYIQAAPANFCPVVAVLWPVEAAARFLDWASRAKLPGHPDRVHSDDAVLGDWIKRMREVVWITVPSLVQHPDMVPSVKGRNNIGWGKDKNRVALNWIGPDRDPLELDWSVS